MVRLLGPVPSDFGENVEEEDGTNERDGQHEDDEWVSIKPTEIPVALSTKAVTGLEPISAPMEIVNASTQ